MRHGLVKHSSHADPRTHLVKAHQIDLPTDIDPLWADAENACTFETPLGINNASCQGGWQRRWHGDSDDVQGFDDDGLNCHLGQVDRIHFEQTLHRCI